MENRNPLIVDAALTLGNGTAAWEAALTVPARCGKRRRITPCTGKTYEVTEFVDAQRVSAVTSNIAIARHGSKGG